MPVLRTRRGNAVLEFTLVGVPMIFVFVSVASISLGMWTYHSMSYAVTSATRILAVHGAGCTGGCAMTVNDAAELIAARATGVPASSLNVILTANAGGAAPATQECEPLTSCFGNSSRWPPAGSDAKGMDLRISARYAVPLPGMYWPGAAQVAAGTHTLGASAQEPIQF